MHAESSTLEFKQSVSQTFLKTVSAFANYTGGKIVFGIADDGAVVGLDNLNEDRLRIEHAINDTIDPMPDYSMSVNSKNSTITLTINPGAAKPYLYRGKAYRRSDTSTVEVDRVEHGRLVLEGQNTSFDALPSQTAQDVQPLFGTLAKHLRNRIGVETADANVLRTLGLIDSSGHTTNAGALLSDENSFPGIDMVRFGASLNDILDRQRLAGISLLAQYDEATEFFLRYYSYEHIEGMTRDVHELIPLDAFREAIANALIHRTWDISAHITVSMYGDRVEIVSPGPLPTGVTEQDYLSGHVSVLRNPLLAGVFFRLGYIEQFGTGVTRIRELYADNPVKPKFNIRPASIAVVLPVKFMPGLSADESRIWGVLTDGVCMSRLELDAATGFSKDKTIRLLNGLCEKGLVKRTGSGPATNYLRA